MFLSLQRRFTVRPSISLFPPLVTLIDTPSARRGINETHLHGNILTPGVGGEDRQTPFEGKVDSRSIHRGNETKITWKLDRYSTLLLVEKESSDPQPYLRFGAEWKSNLSSEEKIEKNIFSLINEDCFIFEERDEIVLVFKEEKCWKDRYG